MEADNCFAAVFTRAVEPELKFQAPAPPTSRTGFLNQRC